MSLYCASLYKCHFAGPTETDERSERITETAPHPEIEFASPEGVGRWRGRARGYFVAEAKSAFLERATRALRVRRLDRSATTTASWLARTFAVAAGVASPRLGGT
jgi:hypothetical protein